jgi:DNA-binding LytR/AlgR family response regulator
VKPIRTVLVDDEPIARGILREELGAVAPEVEIVAEAETGEQAIRHISALNPDLVFLDLQMPGMDGFEVVRRLEGPNLPCIVIVTAYDQHAIRAFEAGAVDYLLKPVGEDRLSQCIDRIRVLHRNSLAVAESLTRLHQVIPQDPKPAPKKIVGKIGEAFYLIDTQQVLAFQAERELVWIVTARRRYLATQPLRAIEERLAGANFARIHRNALVNLDHVAKMVPLSSQRWQLTLNNQQEFVVSKRQAQAVQRLLNW